MTALYFFAVLSTSILLLILAINSKYISKMARVVMCFLANIIFMFTCFNLIPTFYTKFNSLPDSTSIAFNSIIIFLDYILIKKIVTLNDPKVIYNQEIFDVWHADPKNWKFGFIYFNKLDHRIFPPKKIAGLGWTINFANPLSVIVMIGIIILALLLPYFLGR